MIEQSHIYLMNITQLWERRKFCYFGQHGMDLKDIMLSEISQTKTWYVEYICAYIYTHTHTHTVYICGIYIYVCVYIYIYIYIHEGTWVFALLVISSSGLEPG